MPGTRPTLRYCSDHPRAEYRTLFRKLPTSGWTRLACTTVMDYPSRYRAVLSVR